MSVITGRLPLKRVTRLVLLGVLALAGAAVPAHRALGADSRSPTATPASCGATLTLSLQAGVTWDGRKSPIPPPADMPPGTLDVHLPLYPGATPTTERERQATLGLPASQYEKLASAAYRSPAEMNDVSSWYTKAFRACGFTWAGSGTSEQNGIQQSSGIQFTRKDGRNTIYVDLSFASSAAGGTLILYVALAITPPVYPAPGSVLRVPGSPVSLTITRYSGMNPGPHALRPLRTVTASDRRVVASLAAEINRLPKLAYVTMSCPWDAGAHDTLVFRDAGGSAHVVTVDLQGCQFVKAPSAPAGRLFDDPRLLRHINALLDGPGSRKVPFPYDAQSVTWTRARALSDLPGRFLAFSNGTLRFLYLSHGDLYIAQPTGAARLLARGIADAAFTINGMHVLARPARADNQHLVLIDSKTGKASPFALPAGTALLGRNAGTGEPGLSDALTCDPQYVWMTRGRRIRAVGPESDTDGMLTADFLPAPKPEQLRAISCSGDAVAVYDPPGTILIARVLGDANYHGTITRRVSAHSVIFLSWAPDERHLAFRSGEELSLLDVQTGRITPLLQLHGAAIHGAAWDPFSHVLALSMTRPHVPAFLLLVNRDGRASHTLPLPFNGPGDLHWSPWTGQYLGVTGETARGPQPWILTLWPPYPKDPGKP